MKEPTKSELEILQALWILKKATVREINEEINKFKRQGYTTTLKLIQIMDKKGLLIVDSSMRAHVFSSKVKEDKVKKDIVKGLLSSLFENSIDRLLVQAISSKALTRKEISNLRDLINEAENNMKG